MVHIIDRRFESKGKSTVNRQRFMHRFKGQIRKAVSDAIGNRSITDIENGEELSIPSRDLHEPAFQQGRGGARDQVFTGNDQFNSGDLIARPMGGGGGGAGKGKAANDGEHEDDFIFTLSRDEFFDLFFGDLELPRLVHKQLIQGIQEFVRRHAGITNVGTPSNINIVRSMRGALGRRIGLGKNSKTDELRKAQLELEEAIARYGEGSNEVRELRAKVERLQAKVNNIHYIEPFDLRYNHKAKVPKPTTAAVMFCLMDVSGSMDTTRKSLAKRFFMLLHLFLIRSYEHIEVVFIRYHTVARECDEEEFFHLRESGGTVASSALLLMRDIIRERYANGQWNIYGAQASDGDNWESDNKDCKKILEGDGDLLEWCQFFAYVEVTEQAQNLWKEYEKVCKGEKGKKMAMARITTPADIYPVFRELFKKEVV
jgi:uncharacterized protein